MPLDTSERQTITIVAVTVSFSCCIILILLSIVGAYNYAQLKKRYKLQRFAASLGEVPAIESVVIMNSIGTGNFGTVYRGEWNQTAVALKELKLSTLEDFLREMELMAKCRHPNGTFHFLSLKTKTYFACLSCTVLSFYGVYTPNAQQAYMVTEFMENGDLLSFLHKEFETTKTQLTKFIQYTASGMEYLHKSKIIHRDLACRNLLVAPAERGFTCKVGDFGLSRALENEEYQATSRQIPIRWTAPESIEFNRYNEASDVWSFGVVSWEIYTRGAIPYAGRQLKLFSSHFN